MSLIKINRCIDNELRYYGLKVTGLISGLITLIIAWARFSMVLGVMAGVVGYIIGATISKYWHIGSLQKWCYWHLPTIFIIRSKYLPKSDEKRFV